VNTKGTWVLALTLLAPAACYHAVYREQQESEAQVREISYAEEKRRMIDEMDRRMNELMQRHEEEISIIRENLIQALEALQPPARLMAVDRIYRGYGSSAVERFDAEIDRLVADAVSRTETLVGRERVLDREALVGVIQEEAFAIAALVGGDRQGAGYGFISGVQEVDERARVTIDLLQGFADVEGLKDLGEIRRGEVLELNLAMRHDLTEDELSAGAPRNAANLQPAREHTNPRVGRLALFSSDVLDGYRIPGQDTVGMAVTFQNDRIPPARPLAFAQSRRTRIVRGGMVVEDFPWQLDPTTPGRDGLLPLKEGLVDPRFLASEPFLPGVNVDHTYFAQLLDFTVIYDYATALLDEESLEQLGVLRWQLQWIVSSTGDVRLLPSAEASFDPYDAELARLMHEHSAGAVASDLREPSPSDLLDRRRVPTAPPVAPRLRDLGGGVEGVLAEIIGDTVYVSAPGRAHLAAHRYHLIAEDCRFFSYVDGRLERAVLGLTLLDPDSPLRELGFRKGDALLGINGTDIHTFSELWTFFTERPREQRYEVDLDRNGALRRLTFILEGVPASEEEEIESREELTDEMAERLARLFGEDSERQ